MVSAVRVLLSHNTNPWFNLATEDWIFRELDPEIPALFLWRNSDTVVIGKHQNPWIECNVKRMEADGVYLARRQSGGGAVFHDLGNTNFTFLTGTDHYDLDANFDIVLAGLASLGIDAVRSPRNDILVDERKVSGSAFKHTRDRSFHHGTLLINADLTRLSAYLAPPEKNLVSKGIKSVRSRVANLIEYVPGLSHDMVCSAVRDAFFAHHRSRCEPEFLDEHTLNEIPSLNEYYQKLAHWNWRFGLTPDFAHELKGRFSWGSAHLRLEVHRGVIETAQLSSDGLFPHLAEMVQDTLKGTAYDAPEIAAWARRLRSEEVQLPGVIDDIGGWIKESI